MERIEDLRGRLGSSDEEERRISVRALAGFPLAEVHELLFASLGDESWRVRKEAVDTILLYTATADLARELIALLSVHGNAGLRNSVVEVLQTFGSSVLPQLFEALQDNDPGVRKFIVDILGGIGDPSSVAKLVLVLHDEDSNVAAAAAESLGLIGDEQAVPDLLNALDRDEFLLRYAILKALVKIGAPVPLGKITHLAENPLMKKALYECIGMVGNYEAANLLAEALHDRNRTVRAAAVVALDSIRRRSSQEEIEESIDPCLRLLVGSETVENLLLMHGNQDSRVKLAVIAILGAIKDLRAIDLFLMEYREEKMRQSILAALGSLGEEGGEQLHNRFASADDETRCIIAHIAGELRLRACVRIAAAGLSDGVPLVRALSVEAVGKAEMTELIPALLRLLNDPSADVRRKVTGALVRLANADPASVSSAAKRLAESEEPGCRLQSVKLLGSLRDESHLVLMSKDEDPIVRREAVTYLGELHLPASSGRLSMALADEDLDVRVAAATALGWPGFADEAGSLLLAMSDPSPRVQVAVLKSLGRRKQHSALPGIISILESSSGMLLITALQAAFQISPQQALPYLLKAEQDNDYEVARVARGLLDGVTESI